MEGVAVGRTARVILVTGEDEVLGVLPPIELDLPWWQESADVVAAVRRVHGIDVVVLRILAAHNRRPPGGEVTYLAQVGPGRRPAGLEPAEIDRTPQPKRLPYAKVNGPHRTLAWAERHLGPLTGAAQHRTWNLSTIWRLEAGGNTVWLKQVPPFFAHEAAVIDWAAGRGASVPRLIAAEDGRMLLHDIPGADLYGAGVPVREAILHDHHPLQLASRPELDHLAALGVPDRRGDRLIAWLHAVLGHHLVRPAAERLAEAYACGLPDVLVHGDLHPGNARGDDNRRTVLDWGDSFLGHPAFDILRMTDGLDDAQAALLIDGWAARWRQAYPGSDPARAVELLRPVVALRSAAVYAEFVANIEPAEHPYHADDVPFWLERAERGLRPSG